MNFKQGDRIVHPMHGAGIVDTIISRKVDDSDKDFYVLNLPVGDMVIMIPVDSSESVGLRPILDAKIMDDVIESICNANVEMTDNWNQRSRENLQKIKTGDPYKVAEVIKGLSLREKNKGLSTGERKMLHTARRILISETVIAQNTTYELVEQRINENIYK